MIRRLMGIGALAVLGASLPLSGQIFQQVFNGPHVDRLANFRGGSWVDADRDGDLDLFVVTWDTTHMLFLQESGGQFVSSDGGDLSLPRGQSYNATWGDYDNDGLTDVFIANFSAATGTNDLFRNNGDAVFLRQTGRDLADSPAGARGSAWADIDNDGDLDIVITYANNAGNRLYRNTGTGSFELLHSSPVSTDGGASFAPAWGDYDNDGWIDLYITNRYGPNFLYRNAGEGRFVRVDSGAIATDVDQSNSANWVDINNDGWLDLYVCNGTEAQPQANRLYVNNGDGTFRPLTNDGVVNLVGNTWDAGWADVDNDGDLDLVTAEFRAPNHLFLNTGDESFLPASGELNPDFLGGSRSVNFADYDGDGDVDLFITNGTDSLERNVFYNNTGGGNNWLQVRLDSLYRTNRSGIGVVVRVKADIAGLPVWQMRTVSSQSGGRGMDSFAAEFGLAQATVVDSLVVEWPALSGHRQVLTGLPVDQVVRVSEPRVPVIVSVTPDSGYRGYGDTLGIRTTHTQLSAGVLSVLLQGDGDQVVPGQFGTVSDDSMWVYVDIPDSAETGQYDLRLETAAHGRIVAPGVFRVLDPAPALTVSVDSVSVFLSVGDSLDFSILLGNRAPEFSDSLFWWAVLEGDSVAAGAGRHPGGGGVLVRFNGYARLLEPVAGAIEPGGTAPLSMRLYGRDIPDVVYTDAVLLETTDADRPRRRIPIRVVVGSLVDIHQPQTVREFALLPNYPNPFNPETIIPVALPERSRVRLTVVDPLGRVVRRLVDGDLPAGRHDIRWDGTTDNGARVASGVYFVRMVADGRGRTFRAVGRAILLR